MVLFPCLARLKRLQVVWDKCILGNVVTVYLVTEALARISEKTLILPVSDHFD